MTLPQNLVGFLLRSFYSEKVVKARRRNSQAVQLQVGTALSGAGMCVPPSLEGWEAGDAASGVTGSCAGSSLCNDKQNERKQPKTTVHTSLRFNLLYDPSGTSEEDREVSGFKTDPT